MKMPDLTGMPDASWFQRLLEFTRKKITFDDNIDCQILTVNIGVAQTEIGHSLGRTPRYIIPVASYPNGTAGIQFTKESDNKRVFLKRDVAGVQTLILL